MCTAITYKTKDHYFGRNLDLEFSYNQKITITPRKFPFNFRHRHAIETHYAIIGTAIMSDNYPLYFDATNEVGLSMAGLNFPENAKYNECRNDSENITPFEFIPWILCQCKSIIDVKDVLRRTNIVNTPFSNELPLTDLHWIIADRYSSITVETVKEGLKVYDNPVGVLTNNPPFDMQMFNLNNYMGVSSEPAENNFSKTLPLDVYSRGMGAIGLPGDLSSTSRFVKAVFTKLNSLSGDSEHESINQFFHILNSVCQQRGCVKVTGDKYEITLYSSCCNTDKCIYYYTTYENSQINAVDMNKEDLDTDSLKIYPFITSQQINIQN